MNSVTGFLLFLLAFLSLELSATAQEPRSIPPALREWESWATWNDPHRFIVEAAEELHDMIVYQAMLLVWLVAELSDAPDSITL